MNVKQIRQRIDGRWEYTNQISHHVYPIGYCAPFDETERLKFVPTEIVEKARQFAHKHHTTGHATRQEAAECYREYLLDQHLQLNQTHSDTQHKCQICGAWTQLFATIDTYTRLNLCEIHNTKECAVQLYAIHSDTITWES